MKYCQYCGAEMEEGSNFCGNCGKKQTSVYSQEVSSGNQHHSGDAPNGGYAVLGFFFPIVGLILYLVWKEEYPLRANSAGKGALTGFIVNIILSICYAVAIFAGWINLADYYGVILPLLK
ncbi:MAG TPA: zinc ribbon domain-containing protein [Acholeplasmatales bacterium]|nr:zinc ribbon domain-containing protein [Acholeplasmatales bacterium]